MGQGGKFAAEVELRPAISAPATELSTTDGRLEWLSSIRQAAFHDCLAASLAAFLAAVLMRRSQ